jgi:hypothetical protein
MTDQQTMLEAVSIAQRILEEYLEPRPHDNERLLNRLVEVLDRNEVVTALRRRALLALVSPRGRGPTKINPAVCRVA